MSSNDVIQGNIMLHQGGIPHGSHPGAMERCSDKISIQKLSVMVVLLAP